MLWVIIGILIFHTLILVYIAAFLVNSREVQAQFYEDILSLVNLPSVEREEISWDEKYEQELDEYSRRLKASKEDLIT